MKEENLRAIGFLDFQIFKLEISKFIWNDAQYFDINSLI